MWEDGYCAVRSVERLRERHGAGTLKRAEELRRYNTVVPTTKRVQITKYSWEQIWKQNAEQRLKERPSRDCPTWGFISATVVCQQLHVNWVTC